MSNDNFAKVAAFLAANPGSIADEIGITPVDANRLEKEGKIIRVGKRSTGKRGRPPVEWALPSHAETPEYEAPTKLPKLPDADHIRDAATDDEARILGYVEHVFAGNKMVLDPRSPKYGTWVSGFREGEEGERDYKLLRDRYKEVVNNIERRVGRQATI